HVLSRGYGGKLQNQKVNPKKDTARSVGDEPRMIANYAPVWVGKNRKKTAEMAIKDGATHLIMDDGFQNNTLKKDFSILVFDGAKGVGKNMGLPFGRLRESLFSGLKRADVVVIVGWDQTHLKNKIKKTKNIPVYFADFKPLKLPDLKKKYIAFAGIGRPEKFFDTLKTLSVRVYETYAFPDHYVYKKSDMNRLFLRAKKENAMLITTEKDSIKLLPIDRKKVLTLKIKMVFQKETFFDVLKNKIKG
ncbi:MAG: tetraacyldisaccharide 4'-kinase, partial [Alphaproteobacteria bacterium]